MEWLSKRGEEALGLFFFVCVYNKKTELTFVDGHCETRGSGRYRLCRRRIGGGAALDEEGEKMGREVAESCLDAVVIEMVSTFCQHLYSADPELAARRIEAIGYQVGHQLVERYSMDCPRFTDHLEAIKFICKDFWFELFKKQIDNLKTNHRGTFVLQDNMFRWITRISPNPLQENTNEPSTTTDGNQEAQATNMFLYFPCGIIRGALTSLGIPCAVSADISHRPVCSFVVRVKA